MDPAAGVPLHFTVEALGLGVAGVAATWAALGRRRTAAVGALMLAAAQVLYAGQFFAPGSTGALTAGLLRLAGLVLLVAGAWTQADALAFVAGTALVAGGAVWRMVVSAGPASLPLAPRAIEAAGFVVLAVWAWRRASTSVRSRIVAAFIGVLAAAVIVMGGAAARVSVTNAIDNAQSRLDSSVRGEQVLLATRTTDLLNRAALGSAVVTQLGPNAQTIASLRRQAFPDVDLLWFVHAQPNSVDAAPGSVTIPAAAAPVTSARAGRAATGIARVAGGDAVLVAAQPVFRSGGARTASDVAGALVVGVRIRPADLAPVAARAAPGAAAELVTPDAVLVGSKASAPAVGFASVGSRSFVGGRTRLQGTDQLVSIARLDLSSPPPAAVALVLPVAAAADVATAFPRALVGGVLVAALLAVVLALWLASRITRPILSLADEAERVKSDFLATVSHELRTPLTPIRGYADLLRRGRVPRRRAEVYLDEIDEAARRMERIVTLLVEVAAMEAGRYTLDTEALAPGDLLSEAADRWRQKSRAHTFTVRVAKSVPRVQADRRGLAAVLDELVDNAVKFSPDGGTIELVARRTSDGVELAVADQGIGLEPDTLERLSVAFVQAEPGETRRFGGLGLGLTFAAGVLAGHGSHLDVELTKGGGAAFSFTLPSIGMVSRMSGSSGGSDEVKR